MHNARFYYVLWLVAVPMVLSGVAGASGRRFAMTAVAGVYTVVMLGLVWILPSSFPPSPSSVFCSTPVHCFIPPQFPLLLIPALALDLLRPRTFAPSTPAPRSRSKGVCS